MESARNFEPSPAERRRLAWTLDLCPLLMIDLLGPHGLDEASGLLPITDEEAPRHGRQLHQFSIFMQKGCKDAIHIIRFFRFLFSRSQ
jgi:hypothetical protein